ncbi:MAG: BON domain-containing protein [Lentisphaerae bacterium]|nr:BON domain-containing protein [Lentisphaerota bacterium]HQL88118.1 cytidylate kinase family protein [Lentisphaeria bacterium]
MAIIAIARERGALGKLVASELARTLNYRFIDKRTVEERLEGLGLDQRQFNAYDEKKPGLFAALSSVMEDYIRCLKKIMFEEAMQGDCVFLGRGCQYLFRSIPGVTLVRLVAPLETRIKRILESQNLEYREAKKQVDKMDRDREGFNRYFFDTDSKDPSNYHLTINTEDLSTTQIIDIIRNLADLTTTPEQVATGQMMFRNLAMAQTIIRHILNDCELPIFFLDAECAGNEVTLSGIAHSPDVVEKARAAAHVEGIKRVNNNIRVGRVGQ